MVTTIAVGTALLLVLPSCRAPDPGYEAFVEMRARALCNNNFRCCTGDELMDDTIEECLAHEPPRDLRSAIDNGTTTIDDAEAERCFAEIEAMSCDQWIELLAGSTATPASCGGIFSGRSNGEPCSSYAQCTSQYCRLSTEAEPTIRTDTGVCAERGSEGEQCLLAHFSCQPGLTCTGPDGTPRCNALGDPGASCEGWHDCTSHLCDAGECRRLCYAWVPLRSLAGQPR